MAKPRSMVSRTSSRKSRASADPPRTARITPDTLEPIYDQVGADAFSDAIAWLGASLNVASLLNEVERSTARISDLVKAVKSYSYMDQAPQQEIDVHDGIEDTLMIMAHKLREHKISIRRQYDRSIPRIFAERGEPEFRRLERALVRELAAQGDLVIAPGGGIVLNPDNIREATRADAVEMSRDQWYRILVAARGKALP